MVKRRNEMVSTYKVLIKRKIVTLEQKNQEKSVNLTY